MPTRELINRLVEITNWDNIPKVNKSGKKLWIYYKKGRTYGRGIYINYQYDEGLKDMCEGKYKGNVLLKIPNGVFFKKYKGKDKIYVDPDTMYIKYMKKMSKGYKPSTKKRVGRQPRSKKKTKKKRTILFK